MATSIDEIDSADDLREAVELGQKFRVASPNFRESLTVTETDKETGTGWAFEAEENTEERQTWRFTVHPEAGGPNNGVVRAYWADSSTENGGHHELYPRAFKF